MFNTKKQQKVGSAVLTIDKNTMSQIHELPNSISTQELVDKKILNQIHFSG